MELFFLCIKIFFARIIDVSLGTIRTIITVKGKSFIASIIGFVEVLVWFLVVKEALNTNETGLVIAISYALGFATGTYIGSYLSKKFIRSNLTVQIITNKKDIMAPALRKLGYAVSIIDIAGIENTNKYMLFIEIQNTSYEHLKKIIKELDNKSFVVVNETKYVQNGYFIK